MLLYILPIVYALFVWWFSTGLLIYLDGLPRRTFRYTMLGATLLLLAALGGLYVTRDDTSVAGAYLAFTCSMLAWAWLEVSFYLGFITGIRREPCPPGCGGWRHFGHAVQANLYHEVATIALAAVVLALTWSGANHLGLWNFVIMWWMTLSAKLNVLFGVRNLNEEFLPEHLQFLRSFFTRKPINAFFPFSVTISTVVCAALFAEAYAGGASPFVAAGLTFLAFQMLISTIEHWLLIVPLPVNLWSWSLKSHDQRRAERGPRLRLLRRPAALDEGFFTLDEHVAAAGLQAWSGRLDGTYDEDALHALLHAAVAGQHGELTQLRGVARVGRGWVSFDTTGGKVRIARVAVVADERPRALAVGRAVNSPQLQAAFAACRSLRRVSPEC